MRESKPAASSSNFGEKKATVIINKNTVIRRTRTAVNIPSKTVANSKAKKPMSAPGIFIGFNNENVEICLILFFYHQVEDVNLYNQKLFLQLKLKMKLVMRN